MPGFGGELREGKAGAQGGSTDPQQANPPGDERYLGEGRGRQRWRYTVTGNYARLRHAVRGLGTSGGVWKIVGAGDAQVNGAVRQDGRW